MFQKRLVSILLLVALVVGLGVTTSVSHAQDKIKLTWLTHWGEDVYQKPQQDLIAEYEKAHPNVTIELQTVPFDQLLTKIVTGRTGGTSADIYHFYNLWMPE